MGCIQTSWAALRFEAALKDSEKKERGGYRVRWGISVDAAKGGFFVENPPVAGISWHGIQGIDQNGATKQMIEWLRYKKCEFFASGVGCGHDGDDLQQE